MIDCLHRLRRHADLLSVAFPRLEQAATPSHVESVRLRRDAPSRLPQSSARVAPAPALLASLALARQRQRQLGRPRPRLRPRGRDEPVRRLRLRQARQELPLHPRPLLPGDDDRHARRAAGRPRPARHLPRRRRLQRRDQRLRGGARPGAQLRGPPRRRERQAAQLRRQAAGQLRAQAARRRRRHDRRSPASAPTAARSRWCRPKATPARSTSINALAARPVRERGDAERVAGLLAAGGAARAGGRGALLSPSPATSAATASTSTTTPAARSTRGSKARPPRTNAAVDATRARS